MNLRNFVVGLFTSRVSTHLNGSLDTIRQSAREDAITVVGVYLDEFEKTAGEMFQSRQRKLIGCDVSETGSVSKRVVAIASRKTK